MHKYPIWFFLIARVQITAKHRDEKEKRDKDKEETKVKEETGMKLNHATNERFHYNLEVKQEIKEVRFCLQLAGVFETKR